MGGTPAPASSVQRIRSHADGSTVVPSSLVAGPTSSYQSFDDWPAAAPVVPIIILPVSGQLQQKACRLSKP
jgi:hypothetical protein